MTIALKTKTALKTDGYQYYFGEDNSVETTIPPGVYSMGAVGMFGAIVSFAPFTPTNDPPLDIDPDLREIMSEIGLFLNRKDKYKVLNMAHKRGYLFHGGPGEGKSTKLRMLQKMFVEKHNGIVLIWNGGNVAQYYFTLRHYLGNEIPIMIVCEDLDQHMAKFEIAILEFLDGQVGLENFILCCTTNYLDKIPDRIKNRPSRIDRCIEVHTPGEIIRRNYLEGLLIHPDKVEEIVSMTDGLSVAKLKEVVISHLVLDQSLEESVDRMRAIADFVK